jgi:hypothetical protein
VHFDVGRHARKKAWVERLQEKVGVLNKRYAERRGLDPGVWEGEADEHFVGVCALVADYHGFQIRIESNEN